LFLELNIIVLDAEAIKDMSSMMDHFPREKDTAITV